MPSVVHRHGPLAQWPVFLLVVVVAVLFVFRMIEPVWRDGRCVGSLEWNVEGAHGRATWTRKLKPRCEFCSGSSQLSEKATGGFSKIFVLVFSLM